MGIILRHPQGAFFCACNKGDSLRLRAHLGNKYNKPFTGEECSATNRYVWHIDSGGADLKIVAPANNNRSQTVVLNWGLAPFSQGTSDAEYRRD